MATIFLFPFNGSGQNRLARHSERGMKDEADKERGEKKTTSGNESTGLEFGESQRAVENIGNEENWLQSHLWYLNDPRS